MLHYIVDFFFFCIVEMNILNLSSILEHIKYMKYRKYRYVLFLRIIFNFIRLQYIALIVGLAINDRFSTTFIFNHQELHFSVRFIFCSGKEVMNSCLLINFTPLDATFLVLTDPSLHLPGIHTYS